MTQTELAIKMIQEMHNLLSPPHAWCRGALKRERKGQAQYCIFGAMEEVCFEQPGPFLGEPYDYYSPEIRMEAICAMMDVIKQDWPHCISPTLFNDEYAKNKKEVLTTLEKTIAKLQENHDAKSESR